MNEYMEKMTEQTTPSARIPKSRWTVNYCTVPWDPTCSGRPVAPPARISFPDLEQSFPRLERYLHKLRQKKKGAPRIGLEQFPERLVTQSHFEQILQRLGVEKVRQHWNWWILPVATGGAQGCGSSTSRKFALESLYEAIAFLCHPELGKSFFWSIQWIRDQVEPQGRRGGRAALSMKSLAKPTPRRFVAPSRCFDDWLAGVIPFRPRATRR